MAGAKEPAPRRSLPDHIGRYEVLLPLASGGMGTVYMARARGVGGFEREVAIKLLHEHLGEAGIDLIEEAKLAVRVRHPNVVGVLDVGEDPLGLFLVMDYVEGDTLSGLQRKADQAGKPLPMRIGLRVLIDALAGLHAAHELKDDAGNLIGLVHRDFSPQNLLVGIDGVGRLTDFGIAKASSRLGHTNTGIVKGKIGYMSPEQAQAQSVDRRCDVWAAGVIAWQLIAGQRLHAADNEVATLLKIVTVEPPRLRTIVPDLPLEIDEAVHYALTLDLEKRCPTALAFRQALTVACRKAGQLAETEEVAEYTAKLVGPKLAERRSRMKEVSELREKMGQYTTATPASLSVKPKVAAPDPAEAIETVEAKSPSGPAMVQGVRTAGADKEPVRTDTTSVSGAEASAVRRRPRWGTLAVALLAAAGVAAVVLRSPWRTPGLAVSEQAPSSSAAPADSSSSVPPPPASVASASIPADSSAPAANPPVMRAIAVHANANMASLRVGDRSVPMPRAARDVIVELSTVELARGPRLDAVAADGRRGSVTVAPSATVATITFPPRSAPAAAHTENPPPLAPIPYTQ